MLCQFAQSVPLGETCDSLISRLKTYLIRPPQSQAIQEWPIVTRDEVRLLTVRLVEVLNLGPRRNRKGIARYPVKHNGLARRRLHLGTALALVAVVDVRGRLL